MRKKLFLALAVLIGLAFTAWQQTNFGGAGLPAGLTYSAPTLTVSTSGNGSGVLALSGNTSGTASWTAPAVAGTPTNPMLGTNSVQLPSGTVYNVNGDTGLSRGAAGVWDVGTGAAGSTAGFVKTAQSLQVITANYTTSATSLATAGIVTGLTFTAPASVATNWSFRCDLVYSQATAAAANLWGVIVSGTAPTNLLVAANVGTTLAGAGIQGTTVLQATSTGATTVTATPTPFGTIGTTADMLTASFSGTLEAPSNASPTVVGFSVATGAGADAITVYRGSACWFY